MMFKKYLIVLLLVLTIVSSKFINAQTSYSSSPSVGTWSGCPSVSVTSNCTYTYLGSSTIQLKVTAINGNQITFQVGKCGGSTFSTGTNFYLKEQLGTSTALADLVCGTAYPSGGIAVGGSTSGSYTYSANFTTGSKQFVGVTVASNGNRYYTNPITITASPNTNYTFNITSPNSGTFNTGSSTNITWASTGLTASDNVNIELYSCSNTFISNLFSGGVPNTGTTSWYISNSIPTGSYYLKIYKTGCTLGSGCPFDLSSCFTINNSTTTPSITITNPSLAQSYAQGTPLNIQWSTSNMTASDNVTIELLNSSNVLISTLYTGIANDGNEVWSIPSGQTAGNYKIRIFKTSGGTPTTTSATFSITGTTSSGYTINVTSPTSGTYSVGQNIPLNWTSTGLLSTDFIQFEMWDAITNTYINPVLFPSTGTPNDGSETWTVTNAYPSGTYKLKAYKVGCTLGAGCAYAWSGNFTINNTSGSPTIIVTSPILNQNFSCNNSMNINWTTSNLSTSANISIELIKASNNQVMAVIVSPTSNSGSYIWTNILNTLPTDIYKIKVYQTGSGNPVGTSASFNISCTSVSNCVTWTGTPNLDVEANTAWEYLCTKNIINTAQQANMVNNFLLREELAKISFKGLYSPTGATAPYVNVTTPADDFPTPFVDLQVGMANYIREAKVLSYLEYQDGISAFNRRFTHFKPLQQIQRQFALKELMEAFNIAPATAGASYAWLSGEYTDVPNSTEMYLYIVKAYQLGIIKPATLFRPSDNITRKEAFLILYRIMNKFDNNQMGFAKPTPTSVDFYFPHNITPFNFSNLLGIDQGSFNSYTKTSFGIAGKMPLVFAHSYSSALTDLPENYNVMKPMGEGWNHNYNCYIKTFDDGSGNDTRTIIFWGDGTMISYTNSGTVYTAETKGIYSTLQLINSGNTFVYTTKSKVVYRFEKMSTMNNTWCLKKIMDRNNNYLDISWTNINNDEALVTQVNDPQNRKLLFTYTNNFLTGLTCQTGSITRNVGFTYNANNELYTYTDPMNLVSTYQYGVYSNPLTRHLLEHIILPKGNIIDNSYQQRKLVSSQFAGQYATTVNHIANYQASNNTNFTETTLSTTQQGQTITTNLKHDQLGNVKTITDPTSSLSIGYDPVQQTKPNSFTNTTNGITATTTYDANGNVLSVTKTASGMPTITESFTYNSFNDVLTYTNANSNTTTFTYNGTGNLTTITDALSNTTTITPNADGTVQQVTNPSGFYTTYQYDIYGNTIQSKLMNTIVSSALYDDASRLTQATNPNNVKTKYTYNNNDQVTQVIYDFGNLNNTMSYSYDANGNLTTVTNPNGYNTTLTYNNQDQLVQYNFGGLLKKYAYNQNGTLDTFINQNGNVFKHIYNTDGTLASDGYATYGYNATTKNLQTITHNGNGKVITFGHDNYQRVNSISYNDFATNTVQYEYDNTNNITKITYPGGFAVSYTYDVLGRLYQVKNFATNFIYATYSYHNDGRLQQCVNGNGTKTLYIYDSYGRLDSISNQTSSNTIICAYGFTLDNLGNHTAEYSNEPFAPAFPAIANNVTPYTHNTTNRMTNMGTTTTTFNNNGNELTNTGALNATYTWDTKENLLTSTSPSLNCEYDGAENRRKRNNTRFVLDLLGDNLLMETDLSGNPTAYYIQGLGLICRLDATQANPAYYHYDYRGSTTAITNNTQTVTHKYLYGAFGEQLAVAETGFTNQFRFVGKYGVTYEDSSLYFMRARYYNPNKGRFLSEDAVWSGNLYTYSNNNPINLNDINGNFWSSLEDFYTDAKIAYNEIVDVKDKTVKFVVDTKEAVVNKISDVVLTKMTDEAINKFGADKVLKFANLAEQYATAVKEGIEDGLQIDLAAEANAWYEQKYIESVVAGNENRIYLVGFAMTSMWSSLDNAKATLETLSMKIPNANKTAISLQKFAGSLWAMQKRGVTMQRLWRTKDGLQQFSSFFKTVYNSGGGLGDMIIFINQ